MKSGEAGSPGGRGRVRVREVSSRFMGRSLDSATPLSLHRQRNKENHTPTPSTTTSTTGRDRDRRVCSRYRQTPTPAAKLLQDATHADSKSMDPCCSRSLTFRSTPQQEENLPPLPKMGKPRKLDQDPHSFKLLYSRYLQWRFINAKAQASMLSAKMDMEGQLYSAGIKLSDMRESVKRRRIQLQMLLTIQASSTIAERQMPHLDQWCALEQDYSASLCEAADAFKCLSVRLPVGEGVKMDATELGEALESAQNLIQIILAHTRGYMVNAQQVDGLASQVARVVGREGAHIHDCGHSLATIYAQQVEEWWLRVHLIRLHSHHNPNPSS